MEVEFHRQFNEDVKQLPSKKVRQQIANRILLIEQAEFTGVKAGGGAGSLAKAKQELLNLLHENQDRYSLDNIHRMQNLLTSKNLAVDNRIRGYLKRFENQVSVEFLDSLAILSINLVKSETPVEKPDPVMWYGYYAE